MDASAARPNFFLQQAKVATKIETDASGCISRNISFHAARNDRLQSEHSLLFSNVHETLLITVLQAS